MTEELKQEITSKLKNRFIIEDITNVNHKPHPFMLGPKHIKFASDNYSGMIGDSCIEDKNFPKCSHTNCYLTYKEHTSDKVLFLKLTKNITNKTANTILKSLTPVLEKEKMDGIAFVDTVEKFRIK